MQTTAPFLAAAGLVAFAATVKASPPGADALELQDPEGRAVSVLPAVGDPTTVFVFTRIDCPLANRYAPEVRRLRDRFAPQGVRFFLVYPDPAETGEAVKRHAQELGYGIAPLRDPEHALVRRAGARVTPEAAVFVGEAAGPRLVYRGRIDDRNAALGQTRAAPRRRDLFLVLTALSRSESVPNRTTTAIGCAIAPLE